MYLFFHLIYFTCTSSERKNRDQLSFIANYTPKATSWSPKPLTPKVKKMKKSKNLQQKLKRSRFRGRICKHPTVKPLLRK